MTTTIIIIMAGVEGIMMVTLMLRTNKVIVVTTVSRYWTSENFTSN